MPSEKTPTEKMPTENRPAENIPTEKRPADSTPLLKRPPDNHPEEVAEVGMEFGMGGAIKPMSSKIMRAAQMIILAVRRLIAIPSF
ncbi:MAG: hypothetical protein WBG50_14240 [Desulfomonilaceae bacterium]